MIENLTQLKKVMKQGTQFEVIAHWRADYVGQIRKVTFANKHGFFSIVVSDPTHRINKGNGGKGPALGWNEVSAWSFQDGICSAYGSSEHKENEFIISFRVREEMIP